MTYEEICNTLRPGDYVDGNGLSDAGNKVRSLLDEADYRASVDDPVTDNSWGYLTPEADAADEAAWNHLLREGKL